MPVAIGGLEGGGAYVSTVNEVMSMDFDTLREGSAEFRTLTEGGMSEVDARERVADRAGKVAAAIQAPIGVATGALVSKFESAPLRVGSLREGLANIGRETLEEGIQSGSGQLAQNVGLRRADEDRSLSEGVGENIVQGAIYGMGTAGALQAPGMTIRAAADTAKFGVDTAVRSATWAVDQVLKRGDMLIGKAAEASPVSVPNLNAAIATAAANTEQVNADIRSAVAEVEPDTALQEQSFAYLDELFSATRFDDSEADTELLVIGEAIRGSTNRFDAISRVAEIAGDKSRDVKDRISAGFYLLDQLRQNDGILSKDLPEALNKLPADHPAMSELVAYEQVVKGLSSHPEVLRAIKEAMKQEVNISPEEVSEAALETPAGQQAMANALGVAEHMPSKVNPLVNEMILEQSYRGKIVLSPEQIVALETSWAMVTEQKRLAVKQEELKLRPMDLVSRQIQSDRRGQKALQPSAVQHTMGIVEAHRSGNVELAKARLENFTDFAQSMQNKVNAYNEAIESGRLSESTPVTYQSLDPATGEWFAAPIWLDPKHRGSVSLAQQVGIDAEFVASMANNLVKTFGDLGVKPVAVSTLNELLNRPTYEVKNAFRERVTPEDRAQARAAELKAQKTAEVAPVQEQPAPLPEPVQAASQPEADPVAGQAEPAQEPVSEPAKAEPREEKETPRGRMKPNMRAEEVLTEAVEEAPVEVVEETAEPVVDTTELYPNLVSPAGDPSKNRFRRSFKRPTVPKSRLLGSQTPLELVTNAVKSKEALGAVGAERIPSGLTSEISKAYASYLGMAPEMADLMKARMAAFLKGKFADRTIEQFLLEGARETDVSAKGGKPNTVERWNRGKAVNILEDGTYNQELLEGAVLAGLQWNLTADAQGRALDDDEIAKILGIDETRLRDEDRDFFRLQGVSLSDAKRGMGQTIVDYWGVNAVGSEPLGYTQGIPEAVGAEVLTILREFGLIEIVEHDVPQLNAGQPGPDGKPIPPVKTYSKIVFSTPDDLSEVMPRLRELPQLLDTAVLVEPEEKSFIGAPPQRVAKTQMRNRLVENTPEQLQAIRNEQNTQHFIDTTQVDLYGAAGIDGLLELFGGGDLDSKVLNKNTRASLEGKNISIRAAFDQLTATVAQAKNVAAEMKRDLKNVPIHYEYNVSRVGRLHMLGRHNPQSNKLVREAILPTFTTVDLSKKANLDLFMLAVAQAWGVKVHQKPRAQSVKEARELAREKVAPALEILRDWLEGGFDLEAADIATIKAALGKNGAPITPAALHAALEYARYQSSGVDALKDFTTSLYVEADGVTDGPINAMQHMASNMFSLKWLKNMAKGGLFIGQAGKTMNDHHATDKVDLYGSVKGSLDQLMFEHREKFEADPALSKQMGSMLRVLDRLLPDVTFDGETLTLDRGVVKNPLTVTIYGSGKMGIANKVMGAILDSFYEEMSRLGELRKQFPNEEDGVLLFGRDGVSRDQAIEAFNTYRQDISNLMELAVRQGKSGPWLDTKTEVVKGKGGIEDFTFHPSQISNLQQNILTMFVDPLHGAISDTIGEIEESTTVMREAIQSQSIFLKYAFQREIARVQAQKKISDADWQTGDFLSQDDLDAIYARLKHLSPLINTDNMSFLVGGSERSDVSQTEWAQSLDAKLRSDIAVYGPTNAGVAGIPFLIIGPGDGQMMQIASTMEGAPQKTLKIFDGMHMPIDEIEASSRKVNEAVHRGWMSNPLGAVAESFGAFMDDASFAMPEDQVRELASALFSRKEAPTKTREEVMARLNTVRAELLDHSQKTEARHRALARVQLTVDHMASGEASFVSEGEVLDGLTEEQIIERLNTLTMEELANIKGEEAITQDLTEALQNIGSKDEASGVRILSTQELAGVVESLNLPKAQQTLLTPVLRALEGKGYQIVLGTPEQSMAYAQRAGLTHLASDAAYEQQVQGYTVMGDQKIYLHTGSSETVLHELIHAATLEKVVAALTDPSSVTKEELDAVQRLDGLMGEWLALEDDLSELNEEARASYKHARRAVEQRLNSTTGLPEVNRAAALNEFMAWNLSNQTLIRITKRTEVKNPFLRVMGKALTALKELIWGTRTAPLVDTSLYSQIRFNTAVLLENPRSVQQNMTDVIVFHSKGFGANDRLVPIREMFAKKVGSKLRAAVNDKLSLKVEKSKLKLVSLKASRLASSFNAHGFPMTMQEKSTFQWIVASFLADAELNPNSLSGLQDLYAHVTKQLTVESFMTDPDGNDPADRYQAQEKFNSIMGDYGSEYDTEGRSTLLPAFLALAVTNDTFRAVLAKMTMPQVGLEKWNTLDNVLTNAGRLSMERLGDMMSGTKRKSANVQEAIDGLTIMLAESSEDQQNYITQFGQQSADAINAANDWFVNVVQDLSSKAIDKAKEIEDASSNKVVKAVAATAQVVAAVANKERSSDVAMGVMQALNTGRVWRPIHELFNEIIGRTPENGSVYDMIKAVKSMVQQARQQFREELPRLIASKFTRELTDQEWSNLHRGLAKTDIAALRASFSMTEILAMLRDPTTVAAEISRVEARVQSSDAKRWSDLQRKSKDLAAFMMEGTVGGNLLRNAYAVAALFGEQNSLPVGQQPDARLVSDIDQLVSLYALEMLPDQAATSLASLAQDEASGMDFLMSYMVGQRSDEQAKVVTSKARVNHYKGYIPTENQQGVALIVAEDAEFTNLRLRGFERVADYEGSQAERLSPKKGYYFSPVSGRATFNQGIMQNVRPTASGVDPVTGHTYGGAMTAGRITDQNEVKQITRLRARNEKATEPLMPIYDEQGVAVAYERSVDQQQEQRLNKGTHLGELVGAWRGRQAEEALATHFNEKLIDNLHKIWTDAELEGKQNLFVDLSDPKALAEDPVLAEAVQLFTPETRFYIEQRFGGDGFMVRRDMLNDVVGYRAASVGDIWSGDTRIGDEARVAIQRAVVGVFGVDAYRKLVNAEKIYQNVISTARVIIVVKSVVVPMSNLISNIYQLTARGVPLIDSLKKMPGKTAEVDQYVKNRIRQIQVEAELRAADGSVVKTRKLETELQSLKDANRRMSIWPLIEAGEFSSISEGGITREELALTEGRLSDYIEGLADKLPRGLKTAGRYAIIAKDTALFRGLARSIEYGDFLAKAILYDDLTIRQKKSKEEALVAVTEEFINYDRLPGRARGYLESMGMLWFWNFKLRSAKVAVSMIRNNPLQTLLTTVAPVPTLFGTVGLPTSDNIFSVAADGRLTNSMGLGQGLRAPWLLPWVQLVS